jgi:hypothetical protein
MGSVPDRSDKRGYITYFDTLLEAQDYAKELARNNGKSVSLQSGSHQNTWYVAFTWRTENLGSETLEHAHTRHMNDQFYEKQQESLEAEYLRSKD